MGCGSYVDGGKRCVIRSHGWSLQVSNSLHDAMLTQLAQQAWAASVLSPCTQLLQMETATVLVPWYQLQRSLLKVQGGSVGA